MTVVKNTLMIIIYATFEMFSGGLSAGGIAGIVFGVLLLVVAFSAAGCFGYSFYTKKRLPDSVTGFSNRTYEHFSNEA